MQYNEQMITWKIDLFALEDFSSSNGLISYNFVSQESHNRAGLATFRGSLLEAIYVKLFIHISKLSA